MNKIILIIGIVILVISCKEENEKPSVQSKFILTLENNELLPYQIVHFKSDNIPFEENEIAIGTDTYYLYKTSDSTLSFILPDLAKGIYTISSPDYEDYEINVREHQNYDLASLTSIFQSKEEELNSKINNPGYSNKNIENKIKFSKDLSNLLNNLSNQDKELFLKYYHANIDIFSDFIDDVVNERDENYIFELENRICEGENYKEFYNCTHEKFANIYNRLNAGLINFNLNLNLQSILNPNNNWLEKPDNWSENDSKLNILGLSLYSLINRINTDISTFNRNTYSLSSRQIILSNKTFEGVKTKYTSNKFDDLDIFPYFATYNIDSNYYFENTLLLHKSKKDYEEIAGSFIYITDSIPKNVFHFDDNFLVKDIEVKAENISNPNVEWTGSKGKSIMFSNKTETEQSFTYDLIYKSQGQEVKKTINATITYHHNKGIDSVQIGEQFWSRKNLEVRTFRNGDSIYFCRNESEWANYNSMGLPTCAYTRFDSTRYQHLGLHYNWFAVIDPRGLAPEGWRIAEWDDFNYIKSVLGEDDFLLKIRSKNDWDNLPGTNESGLSFKPTGYTLNWGHFTDYTIRHHQWAPTSEISYTLADSLNSSFVGIDDLNSQDYIYLSKTAGTMDKHLLARYGRVIRIIKE